MFSRKLFLFWSLIQSNIICVLQSYSERILSANSKSSPTHTYNQSVLWALRSHLSQHSQDWHSICALESITNRSQTLTLCSILTVKVNIKKHLFIKRLHYFLCLTYMWSKTSKNLSNIYLFICLKINSIFIIISFTDYYLKSFINWLIFWAPVSSGVCPLKGYIQSTEEEEECKQLLLK